MNDLEVHCYNCGWDGFDYQQEDEMHCPNCGSANITIDNGMLSLDELYQEVLEGEQGLRNEYEQM